MDAAGSEEHPSLPDDTPACSRPARAFATLTTNDSYVVGVVALLRSLKAADCLSDGTPLVVMVNAGVSQENRVLLTDLGATIEDVEPLENPTEKSKKRFDTVYSKLGVWGLNFEKIIFLDADMVVLKGIGELFDKQELAATLYEPYSTQKKTRYFDSAIMVLRPSKALLASMKSAITELESFDGGDAGFLNAFVDRESRPSRGTIEIAWKEELPNRYNFTSHLVSCAGTSARAWLAWASAQFVSTPQVRDMAPHAFDDLWTRTNMAEQPNPECAAVQPIIGEEPMVEVEQNLGQLQVLHYPGMGKPWKYPHLFSKAGLLQKVACFSKVCVLPPTAAPHPSIMRVDEDIFYPRF